MSPPRDVRVVLPPGWFGVDLEPAATERSVRRLVDRQFLGQDDVPHVKALLRDTLLDIADRARDAGGVHLWLSVDPVGDLPLPASLLVAALPAGSAELRAEDGDAVFDEVLLRRRAAGDDVTVVDLTLGRAVRSRRAETAATDELPPGPRTGPAVATPSVVVEFLVPIPGSTGCVLLTFSTPDLVPDMTAAFVELFDAVAAAARWVP